MMKGKKEILQCVVMGICLPAVMVWGVMARGAPVAEEPPTQQPATTNGPTATEPKQIYIQVLQDDRIAPMLLEEYLLGVLLAEMPATFETEALKAQAVAARTFTLWCDSMGGNHADAAVCTESTCCQGYLPPARYIQQGGDGAQITKFRQILEETKNEVVCYQGELIMATYFSCSGGTTETALAVWGQDYPYLQSVESPGEEGSACFTDEKYFTVEQFEEALGISLPGAPGTWFGVITYTAGGGVKTGQIGGVCFTGTELRSKLGLRSTVMAFSITHEGITVLTRGYGHRVGLSQYGADAMASLGSSYRQILQHYYSGAQVITLEEK